MNDRPHYPWKEGDALFAAELNAAIANAGSIGGQGAAVSVIAFGADPTGVADSAGAFNAAASVIAANGMHGSVYVPTGTYRVNHQIVLTGPQGLIGDTRGASTIYVDDQLDHAATSVILCRAAGDAGPVIRDIGITFAQPPDQGLRANFRTLAAGGTSGPGGTGVKYPWAIAAGDDSFRIQIIRVRIANAWDGITSNGHNSVFWLEDIEMGAFDCGLSLGEGAGILDFCHLSQYHFWNFGMNSTMPLFNVFYDGQTIALRCGEVDGLDAHGINSFAGRIVFTTESVRGWFYITNLALDGAQATLEVANAFFLLITNMYSTSDNTGTRPRITVNNGKVQIVNYFGYTSSLFPLVYVTGGELTMSDVYMIHYTTTVPAVSVTGGGDLRLYGGRLFPGGVAWTVPLVQQASGGALQMNNMDLTGQAGSTGVAVSFATDVAGNSLGRDIKIPTGWTVTIPASPYNGTYSTLVGVLVGGPTVGVEVNLALASAINIQREISFMTAASLRWRMVVDSSTEAGADAGANFSIARFHDNGNIIDAPISINRASGIVQLTNTTIQGRVGFNNEAPFAKPTVTGVKGGNTALASLLTALAGYGLIVDGST